MQMVRLGRTGLLVSKVAFGALPIQRVSFADAEKLLHAALAGGINFYDTARMYTDSEEKLGRAFSHRRQDVILAGKSMGATKQEVLRDLETSLKNLKTDYLDVFQLHNPTTQPDLEEENGKFQGLLEAKKKGMCRFIGITAHSNAIAKKAIQQGVYDTLQYPFCCLASQEDEEVVAACRERNMGFIAMKALGGGMIRTMRENFAYLWRYDNVVPIYGIQRMSELEEFLGYAANPPAYDQEAERVIKEERAQLFGGFCRGCAYCEPCPQGIRISECARMSLLLKRSVPRLFTTPEWQSTMKKVENCTHCGLCKSRCPYQLDCPDLIQKGYRDYMAYLESTGE